MIRSLRTPTLLLALGGLALCARPGNDLCAGWRPIRVADQTVDYLAAHDAPALEGLIGHHETGQQRDCWQ